MVTTITDPTIRDWLSTLHGETELCDIDGRVLGRFVPVDDDVEAMYAEAAAHFDPEEMRRRLNSDGPWYTTEEVLRHLNSLGSP